MANEHASQWHQVTYSRKSSQVPLERWGHRMVRTKSSQAILFGGFGGEDSQGRYLNDLWGFDLDNYQWRQLSASGEVPDKLSNYTIHYDARNDQVILFGGGALNKARYNHISVLDLKTMVWRRITPNVAEDAPWERTYHSSELHYPFLVVYGGEGISNIDLEDCWAFNLQTRVWKKLEFNNSAQGPGQRRFHSTALIDTHFYVIGGCRGNYELLGDIYRVDLNGLFQRGQIGGFAWQKIMEGARSLERWGHSSDVYDGKIYIFAGRVSTTADTNSLLVYDPAANSLDRMKIKDNNIPKPRRRHASLLVGCSLLCFGGYNGTYLNDFHFLTLQSQPQKTQRVNEIVTETYEQFTKKMRQYEKKIYGDWQIQLKHKQATSKLFTNKAALLKNDFFRLLHQYSGCQELIVQLPSFCNVDMFRFMHQLFLQGDAIFCSQLPLQHNFALIDILEYFNCSQFVPIVEQYLLTLLNPRNCRQILSKTMNKGLNLLQFRAAQLILEETSMTDANDAFETECEIQRVEHRHANQIVETLYQTQQLLKFEIDQNHMRINNPNFFSKAAQRVKRLFSSSQSPHEQKAPSKKQQTEEGKQGCLWKILSYLRIRT